MPQGSVAGPSDSCRHGAWGAGLPQVPAGTQPGTTMRMEGKGAPKLNNLNLRGTHFVKVNVQIPRSLSSEERELVSKLKQVSS